MARVCGDSLADGGKRLPRRDDELINLEFYKKQVNRFLAPLSVTLLCAALLAPPAGARQGLKAEAGALTVIRGRVVCLDETGQPADAMFACEKQGSHYAIVDKDSNLHRLDPSAASTAIFTDARVRARELQVTARVTDKKQLDLIKVQSVRGGKLYDIYYFCEICNIRAYAPGPCPCCRNELEFRETPS